MLLIILFLIIAGGAGVLGRVLDISAWMVVPLALAAIVLWFLAYTGREKVQRHDEKRRR